MNGCLHKASDLAPDERLVVERWLGRPVSEDETITLTTYREASEAERRAAGREFMALAKEIGSRAEDNQEEIGALVDEAVQSVRRENR